jgi:salicylate hydroxylase
LIQSKKPNFLYANIRIADSLSDDKSMFGNFNNPSFDAPWVVAGGGIGGLAAALGLARSGQKVTVLERAAQLSEVGAGIQMGPNAVAVLNHFGLWQAYRKLACQPSRLYAMDARTGRVLSTLDLTGFSQRYGYPYTTAHRADLQSILLRAVENLAQVHTACEVYGLEQDANDLMVFANSDNSALRTLHATALIGADGLWSRVRQLVVTDRKPTFTGDLAYRALVPMQALPAALRSMDVRIWMGPDLHVVAYPVRAGAAMNLVAIISGRLVQDAETWEAQASSEQLARITRQADPGLAQLLEFGTQLHGWQTWALHIRKPLVAAQYVQKRVALLGDAAHPMLPYMAQGAAMAIEDAHQLALSVQQNEDTETALQDYASKRATRNARVQLKSLRNGEIFHATGLRKWGRDAALRWIGPSLMDTPWLYGHGGATTPS